MFPRHWVRKWWRTRITMWKFKWDNSTRTLSLKKRKWQEVIWIVMIGAQNDDNKSPAMEYIPAFIRLSSGVSKDLTHRLKLFALKPRPLMLTWTLTLEASCCFSPQLCSLFQLWNYIWFANSIACLIKKKKHVDFECGLITLCCAQVMGKVVKTIKR